MCGSTYRIYRFVKNKYIWYRATDMSAPSDHAQYRATINAKANAAKAARQAALATAAATAAAPLSNAQLFAMYGTTQRGIPTKKGGLRKTRRATRRSRRSRRRSTRINRRR